MPTVDVFVSYSRRDLERVRPLVDRLSASGLQVFIDLDGLRPGDLFPNVLASAITEARVVLFFVSRHSIHSEWTPREVQFALDRRKPVIPVYLDDVDLPPVLGLQLAGIHRVDFHSQGVDDAFRRLVLVLSAAGIGIGSPGPSSPSPDRPPSAERPASGIRRRRVLWVVAAVAIPALLVLAFLVPGNPEPDRKGRADVASGGEDARIEAASPPPKDAPPEARAPGTCPEGIWCPPNYREVYPPLARICAGTFAELDLARIRALIAGGHLVEEDLQVLFNAYGTKWMYPFQTLRHLDEFFYSSRASEWLPPSCPPAQGTVKGFGELTALDQRMQSGLKELRRGRGRDN